MVVPKTLAENSGFDVQDSVIKLVDEHTVSIGEPVVYIRVGNTAVAGAISLRPAGLNKVPSFLYLFRVVLHYWCSMDTFYLFGMHREEGGGVLPSLYIECLLTLRLFVIRKRKASPSRGTCKSYW